VVAGRQLREESAVLENVHRFAHENVEGAVIRVLDDEILSTNEFLAEEHHLAESDEYSFAYTCCYLRYRGKHVLIDAGFDCDTTPGALESIDVAPEEIEVVLLTHADRDHVAGLLMPDGTFTYPNAQHVIGRELWENLRKPETLDALDEQHRTFFRRLVHAFDDRLQLPEEESEVIDGVRFIPSPGHRIGHGIYEFATSGTPLLHTGDAFFHPLFAEHPDWPNVTDSIPDQAVASRKALVARAVQTNALILSSHIPFPGLGRIESADGAYRWMAIT
jgi:glyoxylase-like metal-dependent hydrolase (beta-lactamase superfamily II)